MYSPGPKKPFRPVEGGGDVLFKSSPCGTFVLKYKLEGTKVLSRSAGRKSLEG